MLKKLIFTVMLASAVISTQGFAAVSHEEKTDILAGVGITSSVEFQKEGITTAEFLTTVANMMSYEEILPENASEFMIQRGVIASVTEKEKLANITYERAITIAVNAMGYTVLVNDKDNVYDYIRVAGEIGILKDVSGTVGKDLDKTAFINLIYNMTKTELFEAVLTENGVGFEKESEKTMLSYYKDIVAVEGKVTATYNTSLSSEDGVSAGEIEIDGYCFDVKDADYDETLIGCYVTAYVKNAGEEDLILHITPDSSETKIMEIESDKITKVEKDYSYLYYEDENSGKSKKVKLSSVLSVIYNGKLYDEYVHEDFMPSEGSIKLVDTDDDEVYDIVHIKSFETVVVQRVSALYKSITNKYTYDGTETELNFGEDDTVIKVYKDGEKVTLGKAVVGDVLSILQSKGETDRLVTIYISSDKIDGRVSYHDEEDKTVKIGEENYPVSEAYYSAKAYDDKNYMAFDYAQDQTFSLDYFGNIVYVEGVKHNGYKYMYLLKLKSDDFEENFYLRVMNTSGDWSTLTMNEKVKLNDEANAKAKVVFDIMGGTACEPQLIMVKTNKDGLVSGIKIAEDFNGYDPKKFTATEYISGIWKPQNHGFSLQYYTSDDAVIFAVPTKTEEKYKEDAYSVEAGYFKSEYVTYRFKAYNINDFYIPDAFVVDRVENNDEMIFIVNGVEVGLDEDDNPRTKLMGALGNGISGMSIKEKETGIIKDVQAGDVVWVRIRNGAIESINPLQKKGNRQISFPSSPNGQMSIFKGFVKRVDIDSQMTVFDFGASGEKAMFTEATAFIQVYDSKTNKFTPGGLTDMEPGDYVICQTSWGHMKLIIIFKD